MAGLTTRATCIGGFMLTIGGPAAAEEAGDVAGAGLLGEQAIGRTFRSGRDRAEVRGRPAAIAVARDGAVLIADDIGGTI